MLFYVNTSPFAGKDGNYLTTRHISERLQKEIMGNVSLEVVNTDRNDVFEVRGRGELQMAILIETMRREGFEFMVSKPHVITFEEHGNIMEPMEIVFLDIPEDKVGIISEKLSCGWMAGHIFGWMVHHQQASEEMRDDTSNLEEKTLMSG